MTDKITCTKTAKYTCIICEKSFETRHELRLGENLPPALTCPACSGTHAALRIDCWDEDTIIHTYHRQKEALARAEENLWALTDIRKNELIPWQP